MGPTSRDAPTPNEGSGLDTPARAADVALEVARARAMRELFGQVQASSVRVGRYLVLERIGAGGMAEVYSAYDPQLERKVALKLLPSSGDDLRSRRLLREAQALARLSHPNVVAVHDAGSFEIPGVAAPRVFLAMELVHGVTLSRWLEARPRTWRQVLDVSIAAGHGLAAAHAAGLVHRDFKPDNVMLDSDPHGAAAFGRVRVVDFGLSRPDAIATDRIEDTRDDALAIALTETGSVLGTPAYMAIEQHEGGSVDPRTDQFSYCVTVWESLYGQRPFPGSSRHEIAAAIAAGRIARPPSDRDVPSWLVRALTRGLSREPDARWPDMRSLLDALADDPARRRRRRIVVGAAVCALALAPAAWLAHAWLERAECDDATRALDAVWNDDARTKLQAALEGSGAAYWASTWERLEPTLDDYALRWASGRARVCAIDDALADRAQTCFDERLDALAALLSVLDGADESAVGNAIKAAQRLPAVEPCGNAERLVTRVEPVPALRERIREARIELARVRGLGAVGRYDDAARAAAELMNDAEDIGWEPLLAEAAYANGDTNERRGEHQSAEASYERALELAWQVGDEELAARILPQMVYTTGASLGHHERALGLATVARVVIAQVEPTPGLRTSDLLNSLGNVARLRGERKEALANFQECLGLRRAELPEDHADVLIALNNVAIASFEVGDVEGSIAALEQALELRARSVGPDHPDVILLLSNLSASQAGAARNVEAEASIERAIELVRTSLGPRHVYMADALLQRALLRIDRGFADDAAMADLAVAISIREETLGPDHPLLADALQTTAHAHHSRSELAPAHAMLMRALEIQRSHFGDDHPEVATTQFHLGSIAVNRGQYEEARALLESALAIRRAKNPDNHEGIGAALDELGRAVDGLGDHDEAIALHREAIKEFTDAHGPKHPTVGSALLHLGRAQTADGDPDAAITTLALAHEVIEGDFGPKHQRVALVQLAMVDAYRALGRHDDACVQARAAVALRSEIDEQAGLDEAEFVLAGALWECGGDRAEAWALAERACAEADDEVRTRLDDCASWLATRKGLSPARR